MNKIIISAALLLMQAMCIYSQKIDIEVEKNMVNIPVQQTQTEIKPGWKIVDVQLKSKVIRYLWGAKATQLAEKKPTFRVNPGDSLLLADLVMIKLKEKAEYRRIPKPQIHDNECIFVSIRDFIIKPFDEDSYLITPINPLEPGEYILTWFTQKTVGEFEDWMVWPFSVGK